jgi:Recombination, repair and ssDNA binding protein UvsY
MTLNDIFVLWEKDSRINPMALNHEALNISQLHCSYYQLLSNERLCLKALELEHKALYLKKHEFLTQGPTKESEEKGWNLPPKGCVLKGEAALYLDADDILNEHLLLIFSVKEKVSILEDILKIIHSRGYLIKSAIDFVKFQAGD